MQKPAYQNTKKNDSRKMAEFLSKDGQLLLPFLELICNTEQAVDELIDVAGKAAIARPGRSVSSRVVEPGGEPSP